MTTRGADVMTGKPGVGPVMLGLDGLELSAEERELLLHPRVGGVILFARNYAEPAQLAALTRGVRARRASLLIAVDQEGGRVQRFRAGFQPLPAPRRWGERYDSDPQDALRLARTHGRLLGLELASADIDFSFAPVLDLDRGLNQVIGDRALHRTPQAVVALARALAGGLAEAGLAAVGKHFPGHGGVSADSHHELPVDGRPLAEIENADLLPFAALARDGIAGMMPALVVFPALDARPACFSPLWLQEVLRGRLGFAGALLSDDLGMAGAAYAGGALARAEAALAAGCDMVLACNERAAALAMLDGLRREPDPAAQPRLSALRRRPTALTGDPACLAGAVRRDASQLRAYLPG